MDKGELHQCALLLAQEQIPDGWTFVVSSKYARVFYLEKDKLYYKEFLPRSPIESLKSLLKGSRATRARKNSETLLNSGFNAPINLAWGKLPQAREYVFTQAVPGSGTSNWISTILTTEDSAKLKERWEFLREFGIFIGRLHATGFIHGDLRTGNVLAHKSVDHFEFSLIDNERNSQHIPPPGKLLLKNLMQLNMHLSTELSRSDRLRFFRAWHSQMRDISPLEAKLIARQSYQWAMQRMRVHPAYIKLMQREHSKIAGDAPTSER